MTKIKRPRVKPARRIIEVKEEVNKVTFADLAKE